MRHPVRRLAMALIGVTVAVAYVGLAGLSLFVFAALWHARPDLSTAVLVVAVVSLLFALVSYRFGTARLLSRLDAVEVTRERAPGLHRLVDDLCEQFDVDRPRLLVARLRAPNSFALGGGGDGAVVVDRSLLELLDREELRALLAHELAHLESHDSFVQTLALSLLQTVLAVLQIALFPVVLLLSGLARGAAWIRGEPWAWPKTALGRLRVRLAQVAAGLFVVLTVLVRTHSRRREYAADDRAAEATDPLALARALRKIERAGRPPWGLLSTLYVSNEDDHPLSRLLSTHPPIDERVDRLVERADREPGPTRIEVQ